ncbi:hypothetical protein AB0H37_24740 [Actinomadura sp. NPDC023710]|uniref:hypothetical protein n=1 Tax=Actinomadura sp. NPDC023710 TaxID=3158219 RepID=UPI0033E6B720
MDRRADAAYWIDVHPPGEAFIVSTAPTYAQVHAILWEEIRKAAKNPHGDPLPGRVLQSDEWKLDDGTLVGWGRKPADNDQHGFQGIHRKFVLVILDEACHDDQTEVMTEFGWRLFSELDGTERLLTMDPSTHEARYRLPERVIAKPYSGSMYLYEAKDANYCVTPDHDMYFHGRNGRAQDTTWRKAPMSYLANATNKYMSKAITWRVADVETHTVPAYHGDRKSFPELTVPMDEWMEFLGWYCSEGHLIRRGDKAYGVGISQKDPETLARIHKLCVRLGLPAKLYPNQVHIHSRQIGEHLAALGTDCLTKRIPVYAKNVSARQIGIFLDSFSEGNGYRKGKGEILYTSSEGMADDLQEMTLKTGVPSVVRRRDLAGRRSNFGTHVATSSTDGYVVTRPLESSKIKHYPKNVREIDYEGMVYCARIPPESLLLTRRNGYTLWSGNCGIPEQLWTAVEAITTTNTCRILAIGNPDDPNTEFGNVCKPGSGWNVIRISGFDTPNFIGEEVPDAVRDLMLSPEWVEDKRRRWGENSPRYVAKCLGEFPEIGDDTLISPRWIEAAQARQLEPGPHSVLSVDVARFGSDSTILVLARGALIRVIAEHSKLRTTETTGHVIAAKREHQADEIRVDGVGVGSGVVDELLEAGYDVVDMQSGAAALDSEHYANARAEWWWGLRQRFEDGDIDIDPDDDELAAQLGTIKYKYTARGQVLIESKDEMKKRGLPSPDRADAVMLAKARVMPPDRLVEDEDLDEDLDDFEISPY